MGKSKKNKKNQKIKSFKVNKKFIVILAAVVVLAGIALGIIELVKSAAAKRLDVAFYNCQEQVVEALKAKIQAEYNGKIVFEVIEAEKLNEKTASKYDLFFAENGSIVQKLADGARPVPSAVNSLIPTNLLSADGKILPVLLDHWELGYYEKGMERLELDFPWSLDDLESMLEAMKKEVFIPFYCSGSDNNTLLAFISVLIESYGGDTAYNQFCSKLAEASTLADIIDVELTGSDKSAFTLHTILDRLIDWQDKELIYSKWTSAKNGDLSALAGQRQIGVFFTSLSNHRKLPYEVVSGYNVERFPVVQVNSSHGLIAPSVVCVNLSSTGRFDSVVTSLVGEDFQKSFSAEFKLAPVNSRCQAYDRQSDDVRFLAAACPAGALPPLYSAVYQNMDDAKAKFADEIRNYLRSGRLNSDK